MFFTDMSSKNIGFVELLAAQLTLERFDFIMHNFNMIDKGPREWKVF